MDDESYVSTIVGSVVDASKRLVDKGLLEKVKITLARDAAEKTILNGSSLRKPVVKSPHIALMMGSYLAASTGRVDVMCSPGNSGKTTAAKFFIHGKHPFRPERSLMISAAGAGADDFALQLSDFLGVKSASREIAFHLCAAVAGTSEESSDAAKIGLKAGDVFDSFLCSPSAKHALSSTLEIEMIGRGRETLDRVVDSDEEPLGKRPVLIIDDFNEATEENETFVKLLFRSAAELEVFVFILTSNPDWATTLVQLNGGAKIKPLYGNVNNADYQIAGRFTGVPVWNTLPWSVDTLRDLIGPDCEKSGKKPEDVIPHAAGMDPVTAKDRMKVVLNDNNMKAALLVPGNS